MEPQWRSNAVITLQRSFEDVQKHDTAGEATALILMLEQADAELPVRIESALIGDSSFMVLRNGKKFYRAANSMYDEFHPCYVASRYEWDSIKDKVVLKSLEVEEGDLVVAGSDGFWDNLFDHQIVDVINLQKELLASDEETEKESNEKQTKSEKEEGTGKEKEKRKGRDGLDLTELANALAQEAYLSSISHKPGPFAGDVQEGGKATYVYGGKPDDITVIISEVHAIR